MRLQWNEERQQKLEALAARGCVAFEIGQALGVSKNAIIGRARRTGVKLLPLHVALLSGSVSLRISKCVKDWHAKNPEKSHENLALALAARAAKLAQRRAA